MKTFLLSLVVLAGACAAPLGVRNETVLSPSQINANAAAYDGRDVVVRGYVLLGTNGRSLYESQERFDQWLRALERHDEGFDPREYDQFCVTMLNADIVVQHPEAFRHQTITVRGRFVKDYLDGNTLDLQACGRNAIVLDDQDVRRVLDSLGSAN